jgi:DNA-binding XRE family transcriptional regulator/predicted RNase H-like HicB family nuclease
MSETIPHFEATRLARNYPLSLRWSDEDQVFVGSIPGLIGECCHGDTPEAVTPQLKDIAEDLVTYLSGTGELLPATPIHSGNPDPAAIRNAMGVSQTRFAQLIGVSVRTLHKWEQHTSSPSGAAKTLLKIAATNPNAVREALRSA